VTAEDRPPGWLAENGLTLAIVAALGAFLLYRGIDLTVVGLVAAGLGFVIFIHELGHFLAAKWCDVHVETFSIGFGPSLPYCQHKVGETTYKIGLIPLGGYVKMLGEGSESEDGEDDPRSYKNKTVGQRMLIISAGVIMNMLLAAVGFIGIYMGPGDERPAGVIGGVDPGSPAWQAGLRSGVVLHRVGTKDDPFFDQVKPRIALAPSGRKVPIAFSLPGSSEVIATAIEPRYESEHVGQKLIGISPAATTTLWGSPWQKIPPFVPASAASRSQPAVEHGDRIVGMTDPADPDGRVTPLPPDPRYPQPGRYDFFEFQRRLVNLAGQPVRLRLERTGEASPVDVVVPPSFARDFGLVMKLGPVSAVRNDSPAARAGVQPRGEGNTDAGDVIKRVEVTQASGVVTRFTNARSPKPTPGVEEHPLDPMRLPFELQKWAASSPPVKLVRLGVMRPTGHRDRADVELTLEWDDSWRYANEAPSSFNSAISIPGLGLAYRVETAVDDVTPDSVAAKAGMKKDDVIKAVKLYRDAEFNLKMKQDLGASDWAYVWHLLQGTGEIHVNGERVDLVVQRAGGKELVDVELHGAPFDTTWPLVGRGFNFDGDRRLQRAASPWHATLLGAERVTDTAITVYLSLQQMVLGGISFLKNANGPIGIAVASYNVAGENLTKFILLLCILSVNLAVLNFLPIPVLDGGHMVFLLYEWIRGRPAPEFVRTAATFAGMALLLSLMACVIVLDVMKYFFKS
jgi:regulator of sigma E protease